MIRVTDDEVRELRAKTQNWWTNGTPDAEVLISVLIDAVESLAAERTELRHEIDRLER